MISLRKNEIPRCEAQILPRIISTVAQVANPLIWLTDLAADHRTLKALIGPKYACEKQQLSNEKRSLLRAVDHLLRLCSLGLAPLCEGQLSPHRDGLESVPSHDYQLSIAR